LDSALHRATDAPASVLYQNNNNDLMIIEQNLIKKSLTIFKLTYLSYDCQTRCQVR